MLRIEEITLREIRLPLREPFRISSGIVDERRIALLQLLDADGVTAWSECVAGEYPNYSPETIDTAWHAIVEWIAPRVLGRSFDDPREIFPTLERDFRGHLMAKATVEMGMWVLAAERLGASLANLLGGTHTEIATGISLGIQRSPEALVEKARAALALGYRKVKINIEPGRVGGFAASLAINAFCETKGIPVWCGGMLESGIGRAYNVALASLRNFTKPGDVSPSARYWERDVVTPEWTMSADGMVRVPLQRPGLGVDVDVGRVDDLTVRMKTLAVPHR